MNQSKWCKNADTAENEPLQWCRNIKAVNKKRGSESLSGHELPKKRASKELLHIANKKRPSWKDVSLAQLESQTRCTLEVTLSNLDSCLDTLDSWQDSWQDSWHQSSAAPINGNTISLAFGPQKSCFHEAETKKGPIDDKQILPKKTLPEESRALAGTAWKWRSAHSSHLL